MSFTLFQKLAFVGAFFSMLIAPASSSKSIIGNFSSVGEMESQVVFSYLATCAGRSFDPCLASSFTSSLTSMGLEDNLPNRCSPFESSNVTVMVSRASGDCPDASPANLAHFQQVLTHPTCFDALCNEDAASVEASWIRVCADVELPSPAAMSLELDGFGVMGDPEEEILACMLSASNICSADGNSCSNLFSTIFAHCNNGDPSSASSDSGDMMMSMDYGYQGDQDDLEDAFCTLFGLLKSQANAECLYPLCPSSPTASPTTSPSISTSPSTSPSMSPSTSPSTSPTKSPSPTVSPSPTSMHDIEIKIVSEFTLLGISNDDVLQADLIAFFAALGDAIANVAPAGAQIEITVISEGENQKPQRGSSSSSPSSLDDDMSLDVEFSVTIVRSCSKAAPACAAMEANAFKKELQDSLDSGDLTAAIVEKAEARGVEVLKTATVHDKPLSFFSFSFTQALPAVSSSLLWSPTQAFSSVFLAFALVALV